MKRIVSMVACLVIGFDIILLMAITSLIEAKIPVNLHTTSVYVLGGVGIVAVSWLWADTL